MDNTHFILERGDMSKRKNVYAVIDNYHEGAFPVIAVCPTYEKAEGYIANRIKQDEQKGNNYDYDIIEQTTETAAAIFRSVFAGLGK